MILASTEENNKDHDKKFIRKVTYQSVANPQEEGVGATVFRSIGNQSLRNLDPFLALDEFKISYPAGFPDHPHRGFETVTYVISGKTAHEDFAGHKGVIETGGLQWMTAGKGIVHAEMPAVKDPNFESTGLQLWVNLSKSDKMCDPSYQDLKDSDIPRATPFEGVEIKVIAGESFGISSKIRNKTPVMYLDFKMEPNKLIEHSIPSVFQTAFIYILSGQVRIGKEATFANPHSTVVLDRGTPDQDSYVLIKSLDQPTHFVLIAGKPHNEPISRQGPFVMNAEEEIDQAFKDYKAHENGFERGVDWKSKIGGM
ncbi:hypothetical protein CONCODRAFT_17571, partial [Conidiobolus coronatus NRRL 28638]